MFFSRLRIADREAREQVRLFQEKKEESEKFMAKINAAMAVMSVVLERDAKVKELLLRQLNYVEGGLQPSTTEEPTAIAAAPCTAVHEEGQKEEQELDKQLQLPEQPEQKEPQKQIAATEREVERDPQHRVPSSPTPTAEDVKKTGSEIKKKKKIIQ